VRPEVVVEVTYLTWTEDNLLRQVSYQGQREDKPGKSCGLFSIHLGALAKANDGNAARLEARAALAFVASLLGEMRSTQQTAAPGEKLPRSGDRLVFLAPTLRKVTK